MTGSGQPSADEPSHNGSNPGGVSAEHASTTDRTPELEDVLARVDALSKQVASLRDTLEEERERRVELEEELDEERSRRRELQEKVERLSARTDLLRLVESSDQLTGEQRSVALLQHLRRAAERQRDHGREAKASVTRDEAERALQFPDVDRTTIYTDMERAARLVGDERIVRYASGSGGGSRLELNLEAGDLPGEVAGRPTNHGGR
jgi:vacuolar-type H+-ATPase subunit I/STV1